MDHEAIPGQPVPVMHISAIKLLIPDKTTTEIADHVGIHESFHERRTRKNATAIVQYATITGASCE